jgi:hypothetical protein
MGFNVGVIKLVFVASTVNLLFNSNSTQPILTRTQIDTTSMRKAWHLFKGGVLRELSFSLLELLKISFKFPLKNFPL